MYITMGTAVYGYISYEFLGLLEVWTRTRKWTRKSALNPGTEPAEFIGHFPFSNCQFGSSANFSLCTFLTLSEWTRKWTRKCQESQDTESQY